MAGLFAMGAALVGFGLLRLLVQTLSRRRRERQTSPTLEAGSGALQIPAKNEIRSRRRVIVALMVVVACGSVLRLDDLTRKTLTHTEAIVPNIEWPADISWPPARLSFYDTFWWHFHSEGHPEVYYFFMWGWTKLFGVGLTALRLPSALFGIGCIVLVYGVASLSYDRRVGLMSAALVAFSGFLIFWSQFARMYMMGCFLALVSTYTLLHVVRNSEKRHWWELAYLISSWLAIYTQTFFWTVLAGQMLWVGLGPPASSSGTRRTLGIQQLVIILGAASLAHIVYLGDDVTLPAPSVSFVAQYLSFGFLFQPDFLSIPARTFSAISSLFLLALALVCCVRSRSNRLVLSPRCCHAELFNLRSLLPIACGSALIVLAFSAAAHRRESLIAFVAIVPFLGLVLGPALGVLKSVLFRYGGDQTSMNAFSQLRTSVSLPAVLSLLPPAAVLMLSFWTSMLTPRAFAMFVPYLLILIASGILHLSKHRSVAIVLGAALIVVHYSGIAHFRQFPTEARNYAVLGQKMTSHFERGDLVFVVPQSWVFTPLFYYIDRLSPEYVADDYIGAVTDNPQARVWLLFFDSARWGPYRTTNDEMSAALSEYKPRREVRALRSRAVLYAKDEVASELAPFTLEKVEPYDHAR